MKKKSTFVILIIIVLIIIGTFTFSQLNNFENKIEVGNATFTLMEGFHKGTDYMGDVNITNGYDTLFLKELKSNNITKNMEDYKILKEKENKTVNFSKFKVNNIEVYKSSSKTEITTFHYWFEYKNKGYTIYTWSGNSNTDKIVSDLIKTLN